MAVELLLNGVPVEEHRRQQLTDREQMLLAEERAQQEAQTVELVAHAQGQAIAAAAYCEAFVQVMRASETVRWTQEEVMTLLGLALRGR